MKDKARVILITGGSRGIGAATAVLAARRDYDVCFCYRSGAAAAEKVAAEIEACGRQAMALQVDLSSEAEIAAMWNSAINGFGRIHALVNNAAILEQQKRLEDFDTARLQRVFGVNVFGSMLCAREAVRHMSTRRGGTGGVIVNVSSIAARLGSPREYIDYAASKGAVDTFTIGLAKEVAGEGIRVAGVRPGHIYTAIHASGGEPDRVDRVKSAVPMQRGGQPSEVAEAIMWLVSDRASFITGTILDVAGGV